MKIEGTQKLHAPRERVFSALADPEILQRCIPGCESLEKTGENIYAATLKAGVGAIKGKFKGAVRLEDMRPSDHYRIVVEGKGGAGSRSNSFSGQYLSLEFKRLCPKSPPVVTEPRAVASGIRIQAIVVAVP